MSSINAWAEFFGWCTLINLGLYLLTVISLLLFRGTVLRFNARLFSLTEEQVSLASFQYLGHYKLATTVLCFAPYVALKIMS
jgi:hypothetical protein